MPNKMLIDASHPEETRVVVTRGTRIEEFDFESQDKKQLRGNIYLARVTRVEPSLQAAFVEYGGNRHGFLAFSEIHPDYYQIPVADRQALLRAEAEAAEHDEEDDGGEGEELVAVPAIELDVAFIHMNRADQGGNGQFLNQDLYMDDLMAMAAKECFMSTEEIIPTEDFPKYGSFHTQRISRLLPSNPHPSRLAA